MDLSDTTVVTNNAANTNKSTRDTSDTTISFPNTSYRTQRNGINRSISYMEKNTSRIKYIFVAVVTIIVILLISGSYLYFSVHKKPSIINENSLNQTSICLKNITKQFGNINSIPDDCPKSNNSVNINTKTKITFVMRDSELFYCLLSDKNCDQEYAKCKQTDIDDLFNDVLFHFVMGSHGNIYEARSLNCTYDNTYLSKEYKSTLVIGMPHCEMLSKESLTKRGQFNSVLKKFLSCLELGDILVRDYIMEFNPSCKNYLDTTNTLKQYRDKIYFVN